MRIEQLSVDRIQDFVAYCKNHKSEVDDSYLYDHDLKNFVPNEDNPTYIALDDGGKLVGAASLMKGGYFKRGKKGRFRIFHSVQQNKQIYESLLGKIKQSAADLNQVFVFVYEENIYTRNVLELLDFYIERYAYFLQRDAMDIGTSLFSEEYTLSTFQFDRDEEDYSCVRNRSFATLTGSETPLTLEEIHQMKNKEEYLEGGIFLLYHQDLPVGLVHISKDIFQGKPVINIGPLAIIPEYQGKGLGRNLLRKALQFGKEIGIPEAVLSANAGNDWAVHLYISEGFKKVESVVCYTLNL